MARKILLADDSVTAQNMGRKILADAGYEVITVNNGSAALKKIGEQRPDLIVLDVYMPGYSGLEVCQRLKETNETARIPILLTVGKLEPFKPEEAKRARADAFIVKPFEASELLSALSKLEDKIVPRPEASKPGRFARVAAAIEENRYDKSMAVEDDTGWKRRIVFPKKKDKPEEEDSDDSSLYNPVNKDLRTVVEPKPADTPSAAPVEQERVDLGALAPAGLPKDVTPEEIAALAAAAAQMKGKLPEEKAVEPAGEMPVVAPVAAEAPKPEMKVEAPVAEAAPAPVPEAPAPAAPVATFAEQETPENSAPKEAEPEPEVAATPAAVMATIAGIEREAEPASSGNGSLPDRAPQPANEPVTTAAASYSGPTPSRWTAVAVALAPEESSASLEQEMRRVYAAYSEAEADRTSVIRLTPEMMEATAKFAATLEPQPTGEVSAETPAPAASTAPVVETPAPAVIAAAPAETPAPEITPASAEVTSSATETAVASSAAERVSTAVPELESAAAVHLEERAVAPEQISEPEPVEAAAPMPVVAEAEQILGAKAELTPEPEIPAPAEVATVAEEAKAPIQAETAVAEVPKPEEAKIEEPKIEELKIEQPQTAQEEPAISRAEESRESAPITEAQIGETQVAEAQVAEATVAGSTVETPVAVEAPIVEAPVAAEAVSVPEEQLSASKISEEPATPVRDVRKAGGMDDMAKRESETAAAWASWRKIREAGTSKSGAVSSSSEPEASPKDAAAKAVAVGAEHSPEEVGSPETDPEISNIVDSVLADLRPKIVEEISRKLGKKK